MANEISAINRVKSSVKDYNENIYSAKQFNHGLNEISYYSTML